MQAQIVEEATPVADVLVIMQLVFQQFYQFEFLKVPQIQFIDRVLDIPVATQRRGAHSANCAGKRRDSAGAVFGQGSGPSLFNDRCRAIWAVFQPSMTHNCESSRALGVALTSAVELPGVRVLVGA